MLAATARQFKVPVRSLIGYRCNGGPRPIALQAAMYLARTVAGATGKVVERELQTSPGSASYAVSRVGYLRTVDPELDQHIRAIRS